MELVKRDIGINITENSDDTHVFAITDRSWDSHNTSFDPQGWNIEAYRSNPIVTYGHPDVNSTDHTNIIGRSDVWMQDGVMYGRITYDMKNPKAVEIKRMVDEKFLNMASIRAMVTDGKKVKRDDGKPGIVFTEQRLIDWGIVMHGSNPNATKRDITEIARSLNIDMEDHTESQATDQTDEVTESIDNTALLEEARLLLQKSFDNLKKVM
jgi:hypothetical protein